jgi:hypothetical protein
VRIAALRLKGEQDEAGDADRGGGAEFAASLTFAFVSLIDRNVRPSTHENGKLN